MDQDVTLLLFIEDVVSFLVIKALIDCGSFDVIWVFIFDALFDIFCLELGSCSARVSHGGRDLT